VQYECSECGHEWSVVYEWPQQDLMPVEDCPNCGLDGTNGVIYHGGERVD
jgi:predicted nucleic acid-binding Zn ribbon protein